MTTPIHIGFLAQHFPDVNLVCGHMGLADSAFEAPEAGMMAENVYFDLTATTSTTVAERAMKHLGPERFVFGTDQPYCSFEGEFFKLLSMDISDEDKRRILWDNPRRIYHLV